MTSEKTKQLYVIDSNCTDLDIDPYTRYYLDTFLILKVVVRYPTKMLNDLQNGEFCCYCHELKTLNTLQY